MEKISPVITPDAAIKQSLTAQVAPAPSVGGGSSDDAKLTNLRYLVLAAEEWPELEEDCEDFFPKMGWEAARGCHARLDEAMRHALSYPEPEFWTQVVDLYTMSLVYASYDGGDVLH